eukprot:COSAG06_NODE_61210_length_268_cov_0.887574_1_plen_61_part_10
MHATHSTLPGCGVRAELLPCHAVRLRHHAATLAQVTTKTSSSPRAMLGSKWRGFQTPIIQF